MLIGATALAGIVLAVSTNLAVLGLALLGAGLLGSPVLVVAYLAADDLVPAGGRTEATTWVATALNAGLAIGAAGAGALLDLGTPTLALLAGAVAYAVTGLAVLAFGRSLEPVTTVTSIGAA